MCSLKCLTILLSLNCVFAGSFFEDCANPDDFEHCRIEGFQKFFKEFSTGDSSKGIKPMDPMILDMIHVPDETLNLMVHYGQYTVTGLKDVTVTGFNKAPDTNDFHMFLKYDFIAEGPLEIVLTKENKTFSGSVKYEAGVTGSITYLASVETVDGKEVTVIGQETVTCEPTHVATRINDELRKTLQNDAQSFMEQYKKNHAQHQARVVCEITKAVFKNIVENFRALIKSERK